MNNNLEGFIPAHGGYRNLISYQIQKLSMMVRFIFAIDFSTSTTERLVR